MPIELTRSERRRAKDLQADIALFNWQWALLSEQGHCDGLYGAEWQRVLAEWIATGRSDGPKTFILERANIPPTMVTNV